MIAALKKLIAERAERRNEKVYIAGYDWAAGMLLRGATEDEIVTYIYKPFARNEFELGAQEALRNFDALKRGVKP